MSLLLTTVFLFALSHSFKCVSPNGENVDWFIMLKAKSNSSSGNSYLRNGTSYAYLDSRSSSLTFLSKDLTKSDSPLGRTLKPIYAGADLSLMYNDETPNGTKSSSYAHMKGVVGISGNEGIWLIHSWPRFPPRPEDGYSSMSVAYDYGQSFLCMSLNAANLNKVGTLLQIDRPQIYHAKASSSAQSSMPELYKAMTGTYVKQPTATGKDITTIGSQTFRVFAKNTAWNQDLYAYLISPDLGMDMVVETWMRPVEDPICPGPGNPYQSLTATTLAAPMDDGSTYQWAETSDHSKWGISLNTNKPYTCVGDINHNKSQYKRGGGSACIKNSTIHRLFGQLIKSMTTCDNRPKPIFSNSTAAASEFVTLE